MTRTARRLAAGLTAVAMGAAALAVTPTSAAQEWPGYVEPSQPLVDPESVQKARENFAVMETLAEVLPEDNPWSAYQKVSLTNQLGEPIDLAVVPAAGDNGVRVLHTARRGALRLTNPETGVTTLAAQFPVYTNSEDGLQTVTLDPNFEDNGWVYIYYAPAEGGLEPALAAEEPDPDLTTPSGNAPTFLPEGETEEYWDQWVGINRLSRFQWDSATDTLDLGSEQQIIDVQVERGQCCHVAGDVGFDADGLLYLSTGDNTSAGTPGSSGYAPNNDATGANPGLDARRGPGNTNDLRGKILRIEVNEDGSYAIPDGNLFAPDEELTRPEIFVMGLRNPFRMEVDATTGSVMWGDYGPDAGAADPDRGPKGYVEWQSTGTDGPLNAGWPYCHGPNTNYNEWDFETETPGAWFDCEAGAENNSSGNTGLDVVPPSVEPQVYYGDNPGEQPNTFAEQDSSLPETWDDFVAFRAANRTVGQAPMAGPIYHFDADLDVDTKFPEEWDGKAFFYEFSQDYVATLDFEAPGGPVTAAENFFPFADITTAGYSGWIGPVDMEFGPDGSLYVLEYGKGFFRQNPDAGLYRVDHVPGNKNPIPAIAVDVNAGEGPLTVNFDASGSLDPEGDDLTYAWDFIGDAELVAGDATATFTYENDGQYFARLQVTDEQGATGITSVAITVGNTAPVIEVGHPPLGGFFDWGDSVPYTFTPVDEEDGDDIDCSRLRWQFGIGHDVHAHPYGNGSGCEGEIVTPVDSDHGETEKVFGVVVGSYTDNGAGDVPPATGQFSLQLTDKFQQAEFADDVSGAEEVAEPGASGNAYMTLGTDDWLAWEPVNFQNITGVQTVAQGTGTLSLRWNDPAAEPFAEIEVDAPSAPAELRQTDPVETSLDGVPSGTGALYVTATGDVDLDTLEFQGVGVAERADDAEPNPDPVLTVTRTPAEPDGSNGWYTGPVTLEFEASADLEVQTSPDAEDWTALEGSTVVIEEEGVTTLHYRAVDELGDVFGASSQTVQIDSVDPVLSATGIEAGASYSADTELVVTEGSATSEAAAEAVTEAVKVAAPGGQLEVVVAASDATSGVDTVTATLNGTAVELDAPTLLSRFEPGPAELVIEATDEAGAATATSLAFVILADDGTGDDGTGDDGVSDNGTEDGTGDDGVSDNGTEDGTGDDGVGDNGTEDGTGDDGDDDDLPDTGGSLAGLGIGVLLVAAGLGLTLLRRRTALTS